MYYLESFAAISIKVSENIQINKIKKLYEYQKSSHYMTLAKGHSDFKIKNYFSQKLLSHLEPMVGLLVGCCGLNGPLRQYFILYRAVSQREGERKRNDRREKKFQTTPIRTYCKHRRPLPYNGPN